MAIIDLTIETDTREFFRGFGVTDTAALDALAEVLGDSCDIGRLQSVSNAVNNGCFVDATGMADYMADNFGVETSDLAVVALVALRTFETVATAEAVGEYLSEYVPPFQLKAFVAVLGEQQTPVWFWPMVVMGVQEVVRHGGRGTTALRQELIDLFRTLGHDVYDPSDNDGMTVCTTLEQHLWKLGQHALPRESQRWFVPRYNHDDDDYGLEEDRL